jgi:hypothetical protein
MKNGVKNTQAAACNGARTVLWNRRSPYNTVAPLLKNGNLMLFYINLGIAVISKFFLLQNFSKINKRSSMFILYEFHL